MLSEGFEDDRPQPTVKLPADFLRTKPRKPQSVTGFQREWRVVSGVGYELKIPDISVELTVTRVRARFEEVTGLLTVRARFAGAKSINDGIISSADFNLSSLRARTERAKHLHERARADEIDWLGLLEEICLRVLEHEERGQPEVPLETIQSDQENSDEITAFGLPLLRKHPTIWFGDGAAGKSLLALCAAIDLAQSGFRVLYCDWEFDGESHANRLRRIVGPVPSLKDALFYRRCDKPFARDAIQIRDIIAKRRINFLVCDSLGFAAEGAPEAAEAATGYFRALRECGSVGSLHLAHMNRSEQGDQKPFGSIFWHAGARATWFIKRTSADISNEMTVGFFNRKSNMGQLRPAFGVKVEFDREIRVAPCEIAHSDEMAERLPLWQRIKACLEDRDRPMSPALIANELEAKENTVRRVIDRYQKVFRKLPSPNGDIHIELIKSA